MTFIFTIYMVSRQYIRSISEFYCVSDIKTENFECLRGLRSYGVGLRIQSSILWPLGKPHMSEY